MIDEPKTGKITILPPEMAAKIAEKRPDLATRIYTHPSLKGKTTGYIIDLDEVNGEIPWIPWRFVDDG